MSLTEHVFSASVNSNPLSNLSYDTLSIRVELNSEELDGEVLLATVRLSCVPAQCVYEMQIKPCVAI